MLQLDGRRPPGVIQKLAFGLRRGLSPAGAAVVELRGDVPPCRFVCSSYREFKRAAGLYTKEPGTIAWLQSNLRPGDSFLDVGANIGAYTIYAARSCAGEVAVTAIEPHIANASRLMENVQVNHLGERVRILTCAVSDITGFQTFYYRDRTPASSNSQLENSTDSEGRSFEAVASEQKSVARVDDLVNDGTMDSPSLVKIDVDGLELQVIRGMEQLLKSPSRPRSIQVEVGPRTSEAVQKWLAGWGYQRHSRHYSKGQQRRLANGESAVNVPHNLVFEAA
jgi:FkbM family methyltransferase